MTHRTQVDINIYFESDFRTSKDHNSSSEFTAIISALFSNGRSNKPQVAQHINKGLETFAHATIYSPFTGYTITLF